MSTTTSIDIMDERDGMYEAQEAAHMRLCASITDDEIETLCEDFIDLDCDDE